MSESISIGGSKGHVEETVTDSTFITLYNSFKWRMITNCTGRYTCRDHKKVSSIPPITLLRNAGIESVAADTLKQYFVTFEHERKDPIYVIPFAEDGSTGLITYVKPNDESDGDAVRYVHTLNSTSGFRRKLEAINVVLSDKCLVDETHNPVASQSLSCM